jgi:hypothetical protein
MNVEQISDIAYVGVLGVGVGVDQLLDLEELEPQVLEVDIIAWFWAKLCIKLKRDNCLLSNNQLNKVRSRRGR